MTRKCVFWRKNLFLLPSWKAGKSYIEESARLVNDWINDAPLKPIAQKALIDGHAFTFFTEGKQKLPYWSVKKETWVVESRSFWYITQRGTFHTVKIEVSTSFRCDRTLSETFQCFNVLMLSGKVNSALHLLSSTESSGILNVDKKQLSYFWRSILLVLKSIVIFSCKDLSFFLVNMRMKPLMGH